MPQLEGTSGWLPSPLDECVAVFHLKVLVCDDAAVLTGANLSDEYFHCQQARYVVVKDPRLCDLLEGVVGEVSRRSLREGAPGPDDPSSVAAAVLARAADERGVPVFGMNLGTVGFMMNEWRRQDLDDRLDRAKAFRVTPLTMTAVGIDGRVHTLPAINEVSLLRETRQTAKLEVTVNDRIVLPELACDGLLAAKKEWAPEA